MPAKRCYTQSHEHFAPRTRGKQMFSSDWYLTKPATAEECSTILPPTASSCLATAARMRKMASSRRCIISGVRTLSSFPWSLSASFWSPPASCKQTAQQRQFMYLFIEGLYPSQPHRVTSGLFTKYDLTQVKCNTKHAQYINVKHTNII